MFFLHFSVFFIKNIFPPQGKFKASVLSIWMLRIPIRPLNYLKSIAVKAIEEKFKSIPMALTELKRAISKGFMVSMVQAVFLPTSQNSLTFFNSIAIKYRYFDLPSISDRLANEINEWENNINDPHKYFIRF